MANIFLLELEKGAWQELLAAYKCCFNQKYFLMSWTRLQLSLASSGDFSDSLNESLQAGLKDQLALFLQDQTLLSLHIENCDDMKISTILIKEYIGNCYSCGTYSLLSVHCFQENILKYSIFVTCVVLRPRDLGLIMHSSIKPFVHVPKEENFSWWVDDPLSGWI